MHACAHAHALMGVIKVGFLNETEPSRVAARLPQYEAAFDAVILGDTTFDWLLRLLETTCG